MVTPLEPPRLGPDLAPDLVLGLDLCEVFRLLDLPTLTPFSTTFVRCPRTSPARYLSWFSKHYGAVAGRKTSSVPEVLAPQIRSRMWVVPGMRLRVGLVVRSVLAFRICLGHARTESPSRRPGDLFPLPFAGLAPSLPAWHLSLPGWSSPTLPPLPAPRPFAAAPGLPPSWPRRRSRRPRLLWPCLRLCRPRLLLSSVGPMWPIRLLVRSADDVPNGDAALCPRALHLGEVHAELLGLLLGGVRGFRLLLLATLLATGCLLRGLLALLGGLSGGVLRLAGRLSGGVLRLLRSLSRLVGHLARRVLGLSGRLPCRVLGLSRNLLGLVGGLTRRVLHALGHLTDLVRDPAEGAAPTLLLVVALLTAREAVRKTAYGVLHLSGGLTRSVLRLLGRTARSLLRLSRNLAGLVGGLARHLLGLVGRLTRHLLGLPGGLSCRVLRLLRRALGELRHLLLGALGRLVHLILDALLLGRLVNGPFKLIVVVGHLLDLGLRVALGELLGVLLELLAVVLDLGLQAADRLRVEVLRTLLGELLKLLLKVQALGHRVSFLGSSFCSWWGRPRPT